MKTKKNKSLLKLVLGVGITSVFIWSCTPENPNNPNEEEVITSVVVTCISSTDTIGFAYSDPDGDGGNAPTIDTAFLTPSTTYAVSLAIFNETVSPVEELTSEIVNEGTEHQFFFTIPGALNLTSTYSDADANLMPIGLNNTWSTGAASSGSFTLTLRHEPDKNALGVSSGNITNAGGETDIEVSFPVVIQ